MRDLHSAPHSLDVDRAESIALEGWSLLCCLADGKRERVLVVPILAGIDVAVFDNDV